MVIVNVNFSSFFSITPAGLAAFQKHVLTSDSSDRRYEWDQWWVRMFHAFPDVILNAPHDTVNMVPQKKRKKSIWYHGFGIYTESHTLHHLNIGQSSNTFFSEHLKSITSRLQLRVGTKTTDAVKTWFWEISQQNYVILTGLSVKPFVCIIYS